MSERDDDLITLLRADLADAASTTPREGLEMRMLDAVHGTGERRPRWGAHRLAGPAVALATAAVLAAVVGAGVALRHTNTGTPARPGPLNPTPPAPPTAPALNTRPHAATPELFAMVDADPRAPGANTGPVHVRFVRADGTVARTASLPPDVRWETVGGNRVFYVAHGMLFSVGPDGAAREEGALSGMSGSATLIDSSLAASPDGSRWTWSVSTSSGSGLRTRVFLGASGRPEQTVVDQTFPNSSPHTLEVVGWKDAGIVIATVPNGVGGGPIFYDSAYWLAARVLDPDTLAVRTLPLPGACRFEDVAVDGSFSCISTEDQATVVLVRPDGSTHRLHIPGSVANAGNALFSPDGRHIAVGTASEAAAQEDPFPPAKLRTMLLDVATGDAVQARVSGRVPVGWLSDGTLALEDMTNPGEAGRPASAELLRPDGSIVDLGTGTYLGALDALHAAASYLRLAVPPYAPATSAAQG